MFEYQIKMSVIHSISREGKRST